MKTGSFLLAGICAYFCTSAELLAQFSYVNNNSPTTIVPYGGSYTYSVSWTGGGSSGVELEYLNLPNPNGSGYETEETLNLLYRSSDTYSYTINQVTSSNVGYYNLWIHTNTMTVYSVITTDVYLYVSPAILTQPQNTTCLNGASTSMGIAAGPSTATFQWFDSGTGNAVNSSGTSPSFTPTSANNGERIYCKIYNNYGSVTSTSAVVTVGSTPSISAQPTSISTNFGSTAMFSVTATGTQPLYYQWHDNGVAIQGANENYIAFESVTITNAGTYQVTITNLYGYTNSASATLAINGTRPTITSQPISIATNFGSSVTFNVVATNALTLYYQWYFDGLAIQGANLNYITLSSVTNINVGTYEVAITNALGSTNSAIVTLNVGDSVVITNQPTSLTVTQGQTASFSVSVSGSSPFGYQWYKKGGRISGATTNKYSITNAVSSSAGTFSVVVTNLFGSVTSSAALLTVLVPPSITVQPNDEIAFIGNSSFFSVIAAGTSPLVYQWYKNTNALIDGGEITGSVSNILSVNPVETNDDGLYQVIVTNDFGGVTSSVVSLAVGIPPGILNPLPSSNGLIVLQMSGTPGFNYSVQTATNLTPPIDWEAIFTGPADTNGNWNFTDSNAPAYPIRFYRASVP